MPVGHRPNFHGFVLDGRTSSRQRFALQQTPLRKGHTKVRARALFFFLSSTLRADGLTQKFSWQINYRFREMVSCFYNDVSNMPQIPDQEMNSAMQQLSMLHIGEFDTIAALKELYIYVTKYREPLFENLEEENYCRKLQLAQRLANVACVMEGEETSAC
jgi:hypothetical protein